MKPTKSQLSFRLFLLLFATTGLGCYQGYRGEGAMVSEFDIRLGGGIENALKVKNATYSYLPSPSTLPRLDRKMPLTKIVGKSIIIGSFLEYDQEVVARVTHNAVMLPEMWLGMQGNNEIRPKERYTHGEFLNDFKDYDLRVHPSDSREYQEFLPNDIKDLSEMTGLFMICWHNFIPVERLYLSLDRGKVVSMSWSKTAMLD